MATIIRRISKPDSSNKIDLVVAGIRNKEEALTIFRQEYLSKRSGDLYQPGITLELVKSSDFSYVIMRGWYSPEQRTVILETMGKKGYIRHTLKWVLGMRNKKKRIAALHEDIRGRRKVEQDSIDRGDWD